MTVEVDVEGLFRQFPPVVRKLERKTGMHPDRKIGIAMGILLVGVVAALFFRNEPVEEDALTVRREDELNQRLRERDVAVYLDTDAKPADESEDAHLRLEEILSQHDSSVGSVPIPVRRETDVVPDTTDRRPAGPLDFEPPQDLLSNSGRPPASAGTSGDVAGRQGDDPEERAGRETPSEAATDPARTPHIEYDEYTVRFGDTLSGIAEKFLGSHTRYREIYEANKDRMSSPDQLRVGKAIRIPRVIR
ncbi:MAG: LysM peptidoglycan-binding domain-containing protein [Fuerstiella sp.]